jgi:hypothetical protein
MSMESTSNVFKESHLKARESRHLGQVWLWLPEGRAIENAATGAQFNSIFDWVGHRQASL